MDLRQLLKADFDIDFPISGGTGNSRDNPIVIHKQVPNDYTSVEYWDSSLSWDRKENGMESDSTIHFRT